METLTEKEKLVIVIDKTDPEIMKQVVVFMYTGKCELNEGNGKKTFVRTSSIQLMISLAFYLLEAAGRYDIKDLKVHTGRCKFLFRI